MLMNKWVNPASEWFAALQWRGQVAVVMLMLMLREQKPQRESRSVQTEFRNDNWIYWAESVCCITVEQSGMDTVCVCVWTSEQAFPTNLTADENDRCNHGICAQQRWQL